jgi:hypothetical protein
MDSFDWLLEFLDPVLVAPFRWPDDPLFGFWLGTLILAAWAVALGELTLKLAKRLNREPLNQHTSEAGDYHDKSISALRAGDKAAYKSINRLANESFGRAFFLQAAMGIGSLWPAFLAAAWLQARFGELRFAVPLIDYPVNFVPILIISYAAVRVAWGRIKKLWP